MKFALVDGQRREAEPSLSGECPLARHPMVSRCGEINAWHWAHITKQDCDPWWENESQWHRDWKNKFPVEWQEIVHHTDSSERHYADVKTNKGWVFEFQSSFLKPEERRIRDAFYRKLIWVVDGVRRTTDKPQFENVWNSGMPVGRNPNMRRINSMECRLIREWESINAPVFFDFGPNFDLFWLLPRSTGGTREYIAVFPRDALVHSHRAGIESDIDSFSAFIKEFSSLFS